MGATTEQLEALVIAAVRLAIVRHHLCDDEGDDFPDVIAEEIAEDTAWALQGEGTCRDQPAPEWIAALASHAPSGHLSFELAERDRQITGLVADNERLTEEAYMRGFLDGQKSTINAIKLASEAAAQPDGYCSIAPTAPHPQNKDCISWTPEIEHNDH